MKQKNTHGWRSSGIVVFRPRACRASSVRVIKGNTKRFSRPARRRSLKGDLLVVRFCTLAVTGVALVVIGTPAAVAAPITDPIGDAAYGATGFVDIVSAQATRSGQTFRFRTSVAAPIPAVPQRTPPANNQIHWGWSLDTDPTTFPAGDPFPSGPGQARPAEFGVVVAWDGSSFSAWLGDRRPLLHGGEVIITPLAFTISGADVVVVVPGDLLDNPPGFSWGAVTVYWSSPPGATAGVHFVDSLEPFFNPLTA